MNSFNITKRTRVNRLPKRASYDKNVIYNILDEALVCNISFKIDGQVCIIPTLFGRKDDSIFIHGSKNNRMLNSFGSGEDICIAVTLIDGIVLAKSAFHHSVNYRSVIMFGKPEEIKSSEDKSNALQSIMEHIIPGRWADVRKPNQKELNATSVYSFKINEASAKVRVGGPSDEKEDLDLNIWAGTLPLKLIPGKPVRSDDLNEKTSLPGYLEKYITK